MNISLTPELEKFILQKAQGGLYHSASEVVRQALRLFIELEAQKQTRVRELNREINIGLEQLARGETTSSERVFAKIRTASAKRKKKKAA